MSIYRRPLISLLGEECELCNSNKNLVLHHKDANRKNNDIKNIQLLCGVCHKKMHSGALGRKSLAEKYYQETENLPEEAGTWLVLYDFKGIKPSTKYCARAKRAATAANRLAKHYGAETVVYKVERQEDI